MPTTFTLQPEDLTTVGGRVSWVVTDPAPNQLPDHVNFTFTLVPTLDDDGLGTEYETTIAAVNDWPLAVDRLYNTPRGTPLVVPVASGLLRNDTTDSDSPPALRFASIETPPPSGPRGCMLTAFNPDGSFTFTPHPNTRNVDVVFFFRVSNGNWTSGGPLNDNLNPVADKIGKVTIRVQN